MVRSTQLLSLCSLLAVAQSSNGPGGWTVADVPGGTLGVGFHGTQARLALVHEQAVRLFTESPRPGAGGRVLVLRGGCKEGKRKKKHARYDGESPERKRARDGRHSAQAPDTSDSTQDSVDELEYTTAPEGGEFGGKLGAHPLGTEPIAAAPDNAGRKRDEQSESEDSSESYPGCYGNLSDSTWEEEEEYRTAPLPTREELLQRIRDQPFNASHVCAVAILSPTWCFWVGARAPVAWRTSLLLTHPL
jgi:hypothetical protein